MHCSDGVFPPGYGESDLELMVDWDGEAGKLCANLLKHGLIKTNANGYLEIHDWGEWQVWVGKAKQRSLAGKANAESRWAKRNAKTKSGNADDGVRNATASVGNANTENRICSKSNTKSISKSKSKSKSSVDSDFEDCPDLAGAVIAWYNEKHCPPFSPCSSATKSVRWGILRSSDVLREAWGPDRVAGHEYKAWRDYLEMAQEQYEHGGIPCRWGILNLCKEENIIKVLDGVFAPKDDAAGWAAEAKSRGEDK